MVSFVCGLALWCACVVWLSASLVDYGVKQFTDVSNKTEDQINDAFKSIVDRGAALAPKFDRLKALAEEIQTAETAQLDASELIDEFSTLRREVDV